MNVSIDKAASDAAKELLQSGRCEVAYVLDGNRAYALTIKGTVIHTSSEVELWLPTADPKYVSRRVVENLEINGTRAAVLHKGGEHMSHFLGRYVPEGTQVVGY